MLYLDTSAMVSLFIREQRTELVQQLVSEAAEQIAISDLTIGEFGAAMSSNVRTDRLTVDEATIAIERADIWAASPCATRINVTAADMRVATLHVRRFELGLLFPDAVHLALSDRAKVTLVTGDKRQANAARFLGSSMIEV